MTWKNQVAVSVGILCGLLCIVHGQLDSSHDCYSDFNITRIGDLPFSIHCRCGVFRNVHVESYPIACLDFGEFSKSIVADSNHCKGQADCNIPHPASCHTPTGNDKTFVIFYNCETK